MFAWWGAAVVRARWLVLMAAVVFTTVGALWGTGVFGRLHGGGFDDPDSEAVRAASRISAELGHQNVDLLLLYSSPDRTVDDPAFREPVTAKLAELRARPEIGNVVSWYDTQAPDLISADRHATYAAVRLRESDQDKQSAAYNALKPDLAVPGLTSQVGGNAAFMVSANERTRADIGRAELLSMPVLLILLILIFGGLVAASMPLLTGVLAILGAFMAVRLLNLVTDVSVFAINIITLIGMGMAIDYALFVVSRFREELAAGHGTPEAIRRTMATAGRTVLVSGLTIALALASLLIFPQPFLRSMGLGGIAAVLVAMVAALTVLPALLAVLGHRINALRIPLPWRRRAAGPRSVTDGGWARLARSVMRRPALYLVGVFAVLAVLASPFLRVEFGGMDERVLPTGTESRVVSERIRAEFPNGTVAPIQVLISGDAAGAAAAAPAFAQRVAALPDASGATVIAQRGGSALISVTYPGEPAGGAAENLVRAIRDLPAPTGAEVLVGGRTAQNMDLLSSIGARLPWMALIMAGATFTLLFLAFGSVVLSLKAVLMNLVSIGASFGVVVWVFQEGHLAGLLKFTSLGAIEPSNPILMLAVLFGLATDYEVFLLSRVREEYDSTGENRTAVANGIQHTGRLITAAALLLIVVVAGFATGGVQFIKLIGVGMIVAIAVDATLVRALLVPATMRLLGRWNWWAPGPLARVYRRYGIRESAGTPEIREPVPAS
ncbi:MMPL family transporter [Rhizomonospora bruguierae]|uniref:MMPL family transporter n=1 Tax=Rhizomonospora bruguierae TaxID=1581705 RepID=UPI001BCA7CB3|nr:MMPL family transporter [Micromonospora sp. NBRC 107566]